MSANNNYKILIVDDVPANIQLLGNLLRQEKYDISFANNGADAIKRIFDNNFDLILLDVMMPEMDGFEVCRQVLTNPDKKDIPIIFLTAKNDQESIVKGFEYGGVDYITKPFNYKELLSRVRTHLELKGKKRIIESMNQILEKRITDRTKQLQEANARLLKLDNAKSDFLALINHELRTPLHTISGFVDLISKTTPSDNKDYIASIKTAINSLDRLINMAILIASLKAEKYKMDMTETAINELIQNIVNRNTKKCQAKELVIRAEMPQENMILTIDQKLIAACLDAIIDNAIKFAPHNTEIYVDCSINTDKCIINITDCGPGFNDLSKDFIFQLFASSDATHHAHGYGLGLSLAKLIAEAHQGNLEISNSKDTGGANVSITIPIV